MGQPLRLYLAGFDIFRPDARAHGERLKALCAERGFEGLYPLDNDAPEGLVGRALADWIYQADLDLIRRADGVLANVNRFRGMEPDSGTAFEMGFAAALGKPVWAYTDETRPLAEQCGARRVDGGRVLDSAGFALEDYGLPVNLMLVCCGRVVSGPPERCLDAMRAELGASGPPSP